jgi:lipoprotein-releasing system permease protein
MIYLAIRYLLERRRQTILTLLGVFFGTVAYVSVSGFFLGFQGYLVEQLVNTSAQVHIQTRQDFMSEHLLDRVFYKNDFSHVFWKFPPSGVKGFVGVQNPQSWYARLKVDPRVKAFSPLLIAPALFSLAKISVSASMIGCDPLQQSKVTSIAQYMTQGKFSDIAVGGHRLILGAELMRRLGAEVDTTILVSVGTKGAQPFKIVGQFATGNRSADLQAYGAINDVQRINQTPNQVNEISVRLNDYTQSRALASSWSSIAPERTESWEDLNANILAVFAIQTALRYAMIATVLIVAGFGIYNILSMTVSQKRQDIAILRSMGYDTYEVIVLFFVQGLIVGACGAVLGLICGYFLCLYLQTIPFSGGPMGGTSGHLHIALTIPIYVQAGAMAILTSSIASILPARAAGKLTPIEIIRAGG